MHKALQLLLGLAAASAFTGPRRGVQRPSQLIRRSSAAEPESRTTTAGRELAEALQNVNLYLIGMMGSGKTSVGELVSRQLGSYTFLDTDATLEAATKRTVADIFEKDGEAAFRELEGSIMEQVAAYVRLVVATGGGVVTRCVEINQCVGCTRQFFTKSFLRDDAAVLDRSSGEEPASPRHRAGVASMAWRTTRRSSTNAP